MRDFTPEKYFFCYLPNWTSTDHWCVVLYVTYSTTHQRLVEVQFGRYQKNILQEGSMVKKLSCVSCGILKCFPHTFTIVRQSSVSLQASGIHWVVVMMSTGTCQADILMSWICKICNLLNFVFHRGRNWKSSRAGQQNIFFSHFSLILI